MRSSSARASSLAGGKVERVQRDRVRPGQRQVGAADGFAECVVLVLGVEDEHLHAAVEQPQRFELRGVGLARAASRRARRC